MSDPKVVWPLEAELGEGPVWVGRDQALWFVDIRKRRVHRFHPRSGAKASWEAPEPVSFLFPAERGGFVAGLASGLFHFDEASGTFERIVEVASDNPHNRLNDGVVGPDGRLWFGTMDDAEKQKSGAFYCFMEGRVVRTGVADICITNGPAISPDGRTLYLVDTRKGTIDQADTRDDGTLANRRPYVRIDPKEGHPDGPTVDSEGCLWIGLYAGWAARRYSPEGELLQTVRFPVSNVTKLALGGEGLRTAFATSARQLLSADQIAQEPEIGDLFAFDAGVAGIASPMVRY